MGHRPFRKNRSVEEGSYSLCEQREYMELYQVKTRNLMFAGPSPHVVLQPFCGKGTAAGPKQSRGFVKFTDENFLIGAIKELMWANDTLPDLTVRNKEDTCIKIWSYWREYSEGPLRRLSVLV